MTHLFDIQSVIDDLGEQERSMKKVRADNIVFMSQEGSFNQRLHPPRSRLSRNDRLQIRRSHDDWVAIKVSKGCESCRSETERLR